MIASWAVAGAVTVALAAAVAPAAPEPFRFQDARITESSGAVASSTRDDVLWTHNDSGDDAVLYAVRITDGATVATVTLTGVDARDWEDLAAGPGPDGRWSLFVGDIGDNRSEHEDVRVHVVPEPDLRDTPDGTALSSAPTATYAFAYEGGPEDAETLLVAPDTGRIGIVTKTLAGTSTLYLAPPEPDPQAVTTLTPSATVRFTIPDVASESAGPIGRLGYYLATGGDIAASGDRVAIRTYGEVSEWAIPDGDLAAAFRSEPTRTSLPDQEQGEGLAYLPDATALLATSEGAHALVEVVAAGDLAPAAPPPPATPDPEPTTPMATSPVTSSPDPTTGRSDATQAIVTVAAAALAMLLLGAILVRRR